MWIFQEPRGYGLSYADLHRAFYLGSSSASASDLRASGMQMARHCPCFKDAVLSVSGFNSEWLPAFRWDLRIVLSPESDAAFTCWPDCRQRRYRGPH